MHPPHSARAREIGLAHYICCCAGAGGTKVRWTFDAPLSVRTKLVRVSPEDDNLARIEPGQTEFGALSPSLRSEDAHLCSSNSQGCRPCRALVDQVHRFQFIQLEDRWRNRV